MDDLCLMFEFFLKTYQEHRDQHHMKPNLLASYFNEVSKELLASKSTQSQHGEHSIMATTSFIVVVLMQKRAHFHS